MLRRNIRHHKSADFCTDLVFILQQGKRLKAWNSSRLVFNFFFFFILFFFSLLHCSWGWNSYIWLRTLVLTEWQVKTNILYLHAAVMLINLHKHVFCTAYATRGPQSLVCWVTEKNVITGRPALREVWGGKTSSSCSMDTRHEHSLFLVPWVSVIREHRDQVRALTSWSITLICKITKMAKSVFYRFKKFGISDDSFNLPLR